MNDTTYGGYTNYETWNVQLWMDNEYAYYKYYTGLLADTDVEDITPDWVERAVLEVLPQGTPDFDTHGASFDDVNWTELAETWLATKEDHA